jgi:hypothetical protein
MLADHYTAGTMTTAPWAFFTASYSNHPYGVNVVGGRVGVFGEGGVSGSSRTPTYVDATAMVTIGVGGRAWSYGIYGELWHSDNDPLVPSNGIAAVYGVCDRINETGVLGRNDGGGVGVKGEGRGGPGGEFSSLANGQLRLVPASGKPAQGVNVQPGTLLVVRPRIGGTPDRPIWGEAELWFCPDVDPKTKRPVWRKVQLGPPT